MEKIIGVKILVVEDNVLNQRIVKTILQKLGAEISTALNGKEAIEQLNNANFDIIIMDLNMPIMDGYETAVYIRNTLKSTIPIIALTADSLLEDPEKLTNAGINTVVTKPFESEHFSFLIMKLIKERV